MVDEEFAMHDDILLPTEANPGAQRAVDLAVDLAERYEASLHVLYVAEDTKETFAHIPEEDRRDELPPEGEEASNTVENTARGADVPVQIQVGIGKPEHSIPRHSNRVSADFIVMGTHGRTGVNRLLVGSVAEEVIRQADIPVLVVPLDHEAES